MRNLKGYIHYVVSIVGAISLLASPMLYAHGGAKGVVKERMDRMQVMRKSMKALGEMVKGGQPLTPEAVQNLALTIEKANRELTKSFPPGSLQRPSEALPAIWQQWEKFSALSAELETRATTLAAVAAAGEVAAIKAGYVQVANTCRGCHADFRKREAKMKPKPLVITSIEPHPAKTAAPQEAGHEPLPTTALPPQAPAAAVEKPVEMAMAMHPPKPQQTSLPSAAADTPQQRGAYLYRLGGCAACHTVEGGQPLAGGLKMETPFGIFYTPNISPDRDTGIGGWSEPQFIRAMKEGLSPGGEHYYPAFPYTAYTRMSDQELRDLKAYLDSQPAVRQENRAHELGFPFDQRWLLSAWKELFFEAGEFSPLPHKSERWNRGAYIVSGPGHCVECHSPRNFLGGLDTDALLTGNLHGPEGEKVPPIHGTRNPQFANWATEDIRFALETGMTPEGDVMGGSMAHVIENSTSHFTPEDLAAVAEYLAAPL